MLSYLYDKESLRKYSSNKLIPASHALQRIIMKLIEKKKEFYFEILNLTHYGQFFSMLVKKQYSLI